MQLTTKGDRIGSVPETIELTRPGEALAQTYSLAAIRTVTAVDGPMGEKTEVVMYGHGRFRVKEEAAAIIEACAAAGVDLPPSPVAERVTDVADADKA